MLRQVLQHAVDGSHKNSNASDGNEYTERLQRLSKEQDTVIEKLTERAEDFQRMFEQLEKEIMNSSQGALCIMIEEL